MANNITVKDANGNNVVVQSTDNASVQLPAHQIRSSDGANVLSVDAGGAAKVDGSAVTQPVSGSVSATVSGTVAATQSGTWNIATVTAVTAISNALPAGTNAIGKLAANSGIDIGDVDVTSVIPGTAATNLGKAEDAAHSSGDTGIMALGVRNDALSALSGSDGDYTPIALESTGRVMVDLAPSAAMVRGTATTTGTSDTSLIAASGSAGLKTYITSVQIANTGSTTSLITFKDGNAGSTLGYTIAPTGGGSNIVFETPLVTSANTAFYFAAASASTTIYASAQGYKAP